jgi:hypothetical protein
MRTLNIIECCQVTGAFYDSENVEELWVGAEG